MFGGQTFVHWVVYKIPGTAKGLPADLPMDAVTLTAPADIAGTIQGLSGFKRAPVIAVPRRRRESRITTRGRSTRSTPNCRWPKASIATS